MSEEGKNEEVDEYETFEEYLESFITDEDLKYLQDVELARVVAELGYRSGRTVYSIMFLTTARNQKCLCL